MPTATLTSKGQITIPAVLRKTLGLQAGDAIDFFEYESGQYAIAVRAGSILEMRGCVPNLGYTITQEEMDKAIRSHASRLDASTRSSEVTEELLRAG